MKKMKVIGKITYWLVLTLIILVAGLTAVSALGIKGNYKLMIVLSGSMEPTIKTGSIVVVEPEKEYRKGDIITFNNPLDKKTTTTHRIYSINALDSSYITKGDANKIPDLSEVRKGNILGKVLFPIPYAGYVVNFTRSQAGLIFIIIIPAAIIIYSELQKIKKESIKLIKKRRKKSV